MLTKIKKNILVVEDDHVTAEMLSMVLDHWGYHVMIARDGEEAYEIATGCTRPDFILSDFFMPKANADELRSRLLQHPELAAVPFLLISAVQQPVPTLHGVTLIKKPVNLEEVKAALDESFCISN